MNKLINWFYIIAQIIVFLTLFMIAITETINGEPILEVILVIVIIGSIWFIITESVRLLLLEITRIRVIINRMEIRFANLLDEDKLTKS
jgi:hypothetical protein